MEPASPVRIELRSSTLQASKLQQNITLQQPLSPEIKDIIRRKVSSYLNCQLSLTPTLSKQITAIKRTKQLPKQFPQFLTLIQFLLEEKQIVHLYKQKIDRNMDECIYFYLKSLCLAIEHECKISQKQIDQDSSVMIDAFLFVTSSLQEMGADKAAFYFGTIAVTFCELFKVLHPIGQFLLLLAKIARKMFRYRQSLILLKKALQYNWWRDSKKTDRLAAQFIKWLIINSPEQIDLFQQKYEINRVFTTHTQLVSHRTHKSDTELKNINQLFQQFLVNNKIKSQNIRYEIAIRRHAPVNPAAAQRIIDLQLQIYNQMSYSFLQLNKKQESKLFAQKYESGYIQHDGSKITALSKQLIYSVEKRVAGWHRMNRKNFQLLFFVNIFQILKKSKQKCRSLDQQAILHHFKIGFQSLWQGFFSKQLFNYEIPLPLQFRKDIFRDKKKTDGKKFIIKQRSSSHMNKAPVHVLKKNTSDKVEQNLIFNYRGIGLSRLKLVQRLERYLQVLKEKQKNGILTYNHQSLHP